MAIKRALNNPVNRIDRQVAFGKPNVMRRRSVGARLARDSGVSGTTFLSVRTPSRASLAPTGAVVSGRMQKAPESLDSGALL